MAELRALAEPTNVRILRFRDHSRLADPEFFEENAQELLDLDPTNVFTNLLSSAAIEDASEKEKLQRRYQQILQEINAGPQD
jgi:DNA-binding transcriptional ArsR family regulator